MNAEKYIKATPRISVNTMLNPGTLFDACNTNLEWNPHNPWGNGANIVSTVLCTGLRAYAEVRKLSPDAGRDKGNWVTRLADNPATSTAAAGVTQLIVAGTCVATGNLHDALLPFCFGVGDIVAAFNKEARPTTAVEANIKPKHSVRETGKDVLATAENWFASGLSMGRSLVPTIIFAAAATFATARKIPSISRQFAKASDAVLSFAKAQKNRVLSLSLKGLGWGVRQLNKPAVTFGLLTAGCVVVACNSSPHVAASYLGFGLAYSIIPTFKSGGVYEAVRDRFHGKKTEPAISL